MVSKIINSLCFPSYYYFAGHLSELDKPVFCIDLQSDREAGLGFRYFKLFDFTDSKVLYILTLAIMRVAGINFNLTLTSQLRMLLFITVYLFVPFDVFELWVIVQFWELLILVGQILFIIRHIKLKNVTAAFKAALSDRGFLLRFNFLAHLFEHLYKNDLVVEERWKLFRDCARDIIWLVL